MAGKFERLVRWLAWFAILSGVAAIIYAGARWLYDYKMWRNESPRVVVGALVGGIITTSAGALMAAATS